MRRTLLHDLPSKRNNPDLHPKTAFRPLTAIHKLANPDKKVVLFTGDGSIMMNCQEFAKERMLSIAIQTLEGTYPPKDEDKEETPSTKSFKIEKNVSSPASRRFAGGLRIK